MATQFISAFIVIALVIFLGVVMTVGVINTKARQAKISDRPHDHRLNSEK